MINDVMVFTPVYRLEPETIAAVFELQFDGALTFVLQRDNPHKGDSRATGVKNHHYQFNRGRELFLSGNYDAMLIIESDIIPPPDTLQRLAEIDCDLAYGCYEFRHGAKVVNILERYPQPARNMGESLTVRHLWEYAKKRGVIECSGSGFGCLLIKRHVIEAIPFELTGAAFFDWEWTESAYRAGYTMKADTAVLCGHKTPAGVTLWPS